MEPFESLPPSDEAAAPVVPVRSAWRANRLTSGIVAGGAAFAMVLAGLGIANAQTDNTPTPTAPAASADNARPHHGDHDGCHRGVKVRLSVAAKALGISEDELRTQLQAGKTIAEVAKDKGVDINTVITALVDEAKAHLAQEVKDGKITQAQADERIATLTARITDHVNHPRPPGGHRGHRGPRGDGGDHRGPRGDNGDRPDTDGSPEAAPATFDA